MTSTYDFAARPSPVGGIFRVVEAVLLADDAQRPLLGVLVRPPQVLADDAEAERVQSSEKLTVVTVAT